MYVLLAQESTCTTGKRRRVAKRALNALGGVSGVCGFVNDDKQMKEIRLNMKFADSFEALKSAEKCMKLAKIQTKHKEAYKLAREKLKFGPQDKFLKSHAPKLTIAQMKVIVQPSPTHIHTLLMDYSFPTVGRRVC